MEDDAQLRRVEEEPHAPVYAQQRWSATVLEKVHNDTQPRRPGMVVEEG
jgi:hypothetical protein